MMPTNWEVLTNAVGPIFGIVIPILALVISTLGWLSNAVPDAITKTCALARDALFHGFGLIDNTLRLITTQLGTLDTRLTNLLHNPPNINILADVPPIMVTLNVPAPAVPAPAPGPTMEEYRALLDRMARLEADMTALRTNVVSDQCNCPISTSLAATVEALAKENRLLRARPTNAEFEALKEENRLLRARPDPQQENLKRLGGD